MANCSHNYHFHHLPGWGEDSGEEGTEGTLCMFSACVCVWPLQEETMATWSIILRCLCTCVSACVLYNFVCSCLWFLSVCVCVPLSFGQSARVRGCVCVCGGGVSDKLNKACLCLCPYSFHLSVSLRANRANLGLWDTDAHTNTPSLLSSVPPKEPTFR